MKIFRIGMILLPLYFSPHPAAAREANLINNNSFVYGMKCWKHSGAGGVVKLPKGIRFTGGILAHYLDQGNLEHAQPDCYAPAGRVFRFRIKARGKGQLRLGVRARVMYAGNALEFTEQWSDIFTLDDKFRYFDFENFTADPDTVFHDKLMVKLASDGEAEIVSSSFFYLDRNGVKLSFSPEAAVARPGDRVKVLLHSSLPEIKLHCSLYPGQSIPAGYFPARHWETVCDAGGKAEISFTVPYEVADGVRLSVLDKNSGVKKNFFVSVLPEKMLNRYRQMSKKISGTQHLLFLGDSLSDYDRGRNYINVSGCFLPQTYSVRNCGVGGDTLRRIWQRLNGEKTIRNYMYENIFSPNPDMIFILTGANDSKVFSRSNYKETYVPEAEQPDLWDKIITFLKKKTGAKIVLITSPYSYLPYQQALSQPLKQQNMAHSLFGLPEFHDRFNARLKQIAAKHGVEVIDFASAVQKHPDPQQLYVPDDGVHLSPKGHQLLAGEILKFLAAGEVPVNHGGSRKWENVYEFNGDNRVRLADSSDLNAGSAGLTAVAEVFPYDSGNDTATPAADALDMYIFKERSFFLGRYGDRIYANFHDGNRYCAHTMSKPGKFPHPGKWSQVAAVFEPLTSGYAVKIYLNGELTGQKEFPGRIPHLNRAFAELGSGWGGAWHYRGKMKNIRLIPRVLTGKELTELSEK